MDHRREARVGFVVTGGDAAELLDLAEEVFDQMAPLVHLEVTGDCGDPIGFGRDHGGRPRLSNSVRSPSLSKALSASRAAKSRSVRSGATPALSCPAAGRTARERIDQRDDRQATAGPPDGLRPSSCAATVLVHPDDGAIDDDVFEVGIRRQGFEKLIEHAASDPPTESLIPMPESSDLSLMTDSVGKGRFS